MIEQLNFYMTEASPELLEIRREYIERVIVGKLKRGIEIFRSWTPDSCSTPETAALISAYESGLKFFSERGFNNA